MFLLGIGIIIYSIKDIDVSLLIRDFMTLKFGWLLVALGCILLYLAIEGVITKLLMKDTPSFSFKDAFRVPLVEQLFNGITPFSSGGQPGQLFIMLQTGVDGGKASSILLMKFVVYQAMIVVNFFVSLLIGFSYVAEKMKLLALLIGFGFVIHLLVILGLLMIMYVPKVTKKMVYWGVYPLKWFLNAKRYEQINNTLSQKVDNLYLESVKLSHQPKLILKIAGLTFIQLLFYYLIPYFIMLAMGYHGINVIMITSLHVMIVMIISLFPIPGGSGGAELSFSSLFSSYISSNTKLVLAMILWRILTYYLGMILGVIALVIKPDRIDN